VEPCCYCGEESENYLELDTEDGRYAYYCLSCFEYFSHLEKTLARFSWPHEEEKEDDKK
jgi:hypothetical protein